MSLSFKTAMSLLVLLICQYSIAQKKTASIECLQYYPKIRFILAAPVILPKLLQEGKLNQLQNFIENWKRSDAPSDELIFSINTLLAIENKKFSTLQLPCDVFYFLEDYARELKNIEDNSPKFKYYIRISAGYWYDATPDASRFLLFVRTWARSLIATRQLNNMEQFLCGVFAGEIRHPRSTFRCNRKNYTELNNFQHNLGIYNKQYFISQRNGNAVTSGIMAGLWSPTGNLKTLGVHPAIGVSLGGRNAKNEYDLVWSIRFGHPTPHDYTILRNDSLYISNYYDGGYIGFDYTRYILHKTYFELGCIYAVGYDYFNITDGFGRSEPRPSLIPINIGSFDFNYGLRFKYFLRSGAFIGLAAKYHLIHYSNRGGTDLSGNAISIDLIYGSH